MKSGIFERTLFPSIPCHSGDSKDKWIYAFNEAEPREWTHNSNFPKIWSKVIKHVCHYDFALARLSWEILPEDETFVADWAHLERIRKEMKRNQYGFADKKDKREILKAKEKYVKSRILLKNYRGNYSLPELLIRNPIPLSRILAEELIVENNSFKPLNCLTLKALIV